MIAIICLHLLEKSNLAQDLLSNMSEVIGGFRGSLAIAVIFVGLIAASTGIVGATVIAMGLISLPIMATRDIYNLRWLFHLICISNVLSGLLISAIFPLVSIFMGALIPISHCSSFSTMAENYLWELVF